MAPKKADLDGKLDEILELLKGLVETVQAPAPAPTGPSHHDHDLLQREYHDLQRKYTGAVSEVMALRQAAAAKPPAPIPAPLGAQAPVPVKPKGPPAQTAFRTSGFKPY